MIRKVLAAALLAAFALSVSVMAAGPMLKVSKGDAAAVTVDISTLEQVSGKAYYKNSKGVLSGPFSIKGVRLSDVLKAAGGILEAEKLVVTSSDGYVTELTFAQVMGKMDITRADGSAETEKVEVIPVIITWSEPAMEKDLPRLSFITKDGHITESKYWARNVVEFKVVAVK